ncbi:PREDICTED: uncharacterized protein LOC109242139 [Nicotiana attenuata]|uniref:uncharacterized protein LOC109242139 n=1 Tax=Nicotiana attenuata TaxID=49451 RepID=UPI000905390E|nr:PREDICTED: uncharacterized protein LOC109242139 [Nicotiana attenuata]
MATASSSRTAPAPAEKPEKFSGVDFKCCIMKTSRELWIALEKKYKTEDTGLKKFVAAKFLDFKMVDGKSVIMQVQEMQVIVHDLLVEEKLPSPWMDFKNYLKHKRKEMTLEDLIVCLRIEEDNKAAEKKSRVGHKVVDCRAPKKDKKKIQANMVEKNDEMEDLCAMVSECSLVGNLKEWWIDFGATLHICANKELFASYVPAWPDETIFMGNSAIEKIEEVGHISLKMTSGKVVTLNSILHVPEIHKNLVSAELHIKNGFK